VAHINAVPMSKGMNWSEYSRHCYEKFGRTKDFGCSCGQNLFGASGMCRICGKYKGQPGKKDDRSVPNLCWTDDLYELCCPVLNPDVKLNHSEQQYALRAITQRLKVTPWDWQGPDRPLKSAVDAGCTDLVFVMLEAGMSVDEADVRGVTALHDAVFAGRLDICKILLDGRASVNIRDRHGQTPLFFVGAVDICKLLCEAQADVSMVNTKGQTALHLAGRAGLREVLNELTEQVSKAVVGLHDSFGATAAQYLQISNPEPEEEVSTLPGRSVSRARRAKSERRWNPRERSTSQGKKSSNDENIRNPVRNQRSDSSFSSSTVFSAAPLPGPQHTLKEIRSYMRMSQAAAGDRGARASSPDRLARQQAWKDDDDAAETFDAVVATGGSLREGKVSNAQEESSPDRTAPLAQWLVERQESGPDSGISKISTDGTKNKRQAQKRRSPTPGYFHEVKQDASADTASNANSEAPSGTGSIMSFMGLGSPGGENVEPSDDGFGQEAF